MINTSQFIRVVDTTLKKYEELGGARYSEAARNLLVMVAAHESKLGTFLFQVGGGPALGVYQHEPASICDLYKEFISKNRTLDFAVSKFTPSRRSLTTDDFYELVVTDLRYATVLARAHFQRYREPLPSEPYDLAVYAKKYWNTEAGKASINDYLTAYQRAMAGVK